jgi:lysophospholipase L1-like esterase
MRDHTPPAGRGRGRAGFLAQFCSRLVLLALGLTLGLAAVELLARRLAPQRLYHHPRGLFVTHPTRTYELAPRFRGRLDTREFRVEMATNGSGLRDERDYDARHPDTVRILAVGDSFTSGLGVEATETFVKVLERRLNASASRPRFEVVNAGVPSYSTREAALFLKEEGSAFQPDLVLVGFFVGNDVVDNAGRGRWRVIDGELVDATRDPLLPLTLRRLLARHSHFYHLAWPLRRSLLELRSRDGGAARDLAIFGPPDGEAAVFWQATRRWLVRLRTLSRARRWPLAVALIPARMQVDGEAWNTTVRPAHASALRPFYDATRPNRVLAAMLREIGVPALDLLEPLRHASTEHTVYFPLDGHLTVAGNRVVAEALFDWLCAEGLVPTGDHTVLAGRR